MKKLLSAVVFLFVLVLSVSLCHASPSALQGESEKEGKGKEVTKFLGIPVDGSKADMVKKLQAKGFKYDPRTELLYGTFNDLDSGIHVKEDNGKVSMISVIPELSTKAHVILRFNILLSQFEESGKYVFAFGDKTIPEEENISYEMRIKNRIYKAVFIQLPEGVTKERIKSIGTSERSQEENDLMEHCFKRLVLVTIVEDAADYRVVISYVNGYNMNGGSDL